MIEQRSLGKSGKKYLKAWIAYRAGVIKCTGQNCALGFFWLINLGILILLDKSHHCM